MPGRTTNSSRPGRKASTGSSRRGRKASTASSSQPSRRGEQPVPRADGNPSGAAAAVRGGTASLPRRGKGQRAASQQGAGARHATAGPRGRGRGPEQQHVRQAAWQQHRAGNWQSDHRTWQQRGGYHGYRIPDSSLPRFLWVGTRVPDQGLPFMEVGGYPRFQYKGYWLSVVDPWPPNGAMTGTITTRYM